jgi:hypothetical protein
MTRCRAWLIALLLLGACAPSPSPSSSAPEIRLFGRITAVTTERVTVAAASFLTGKAAEDAAREDGREAPGGFYIRDLRRVDVLAVVGNVDISVLGYDAAGNPSPVPFDLARLGAAIDAWNSGAGLPDLYWTNYWWFSVVDVTVVKIEAQYLP